MLRFRRKRRFGGGSGVSDVAILRHTAHWTLDDLDVGSKKSGTLLSLRVYFVLILPAGKGIGGGVHGMLQQALGATC